MDYNLDGKVFRAVSNAPNGEVGSETRFHYRQNGRIVTATYHGGEIVSGHLIATVRDSGQLDMRYHHVNVKGELMLGTCLSTPKLMPGGKLRFVEEWQWLSGDRSSGRSEIEEV